MTRPWAEEDMTHEVAPTASSDSATSAWKPSASPLSARARASTSPTPTTAMVN